MPLSKCLLTGLQPWEHMHSHGLFMAINLFQPVTFLPWLQWGLEQFLRYIQLQKLKCIILNNNEKLCTRGSTTDSAAQPVRKTFLLHRTGKHMHMSLMNFETLLFLPGTKFRVTAMPQVDMKIVILSSPMLLVLACNALFHFVSRKGIIFSVWRLFPQFRWTVNYNKFNN